MLLSGAGRHDAHKHGWEFREDLVVANPEDAVATGFQVPCAVLVLFGLPTVDLAVHLYRELDGRAGEVEDEGIDGVRTTEPEALKLTPP